MYAFLLVLGSVIAAAGLALVASGVSIQEHTFDASNVTPGTIAVIGGAILIGLAFVVRALLRVERALMARPMSRPARPGEALGAVVAAAQPSEQARIPFPPKSKTIPQPPPVPAAAQPAAVEGAVPESLRPPVPPPMENAPVVEESDVSLLPNAPARSDQDSGEVHHGVAGRGNGAAPGQGRAAGCRQRSAAAAAATRNRKVRFSIPFGRRRSARRRKFRQRPLPRRPRLRRSHRRSQYRNTPRQQANQPDPQARGGATAGTRVVSILKSGVVEGMAYTLYSDGSIEAQLPGGTLRFGSITELRNHIEQNG